MLPSWARQLFRNKFVGQGTVAPLCNGLSVEALEDRSLMATITWTGAVAAATGDFSWGAAIIVNNTIVTNWDSGTPTLAGAGSQALDVRFPAGAFHPATTNPNSIIDDEYEINDLQIQGSNYYISSLASHTLTLNGRLLVDFAGPVGPNTGLSLLGALPSVQPISSLKVVLNDNVTTNPGFGPANQFINSNTGELYITATLTDGFTPATGTVRPSGLIKNGTGTISLAGNNTYTGVTSVQAGILIAASDGALGASSAQTLVSNGATIGVSGGTIGDSLQILGTGVGGLGALRGMRDSLATFQGGVAGGGTWAGGVALLGDATIGVDTFNVTDLAITTNGIAGTGNLTKVGTGELRLVVDSTYSGNTAITAGGVGIFTDNALAAGFQTTVSNGATLWLDGGLSVPETLVITGDGSTNYLDGFGRPAGALTLRPVNPGTPSTWTGSITLTAAGASIGALAGGTLTLGGPLAVPAAAALGKVERGRVRVARANTGFLGTTQINNGTVEIADAKALGSGLITVNSTTGAQTAVGTLQIEATDINTPLTLTNRLTLNGAGDSNAGAVHVVAPAGSGPLGASGVTLSGAVLLNATTNLNVDPRSTLTVSGVISDTTLPQAPELDKLGGGTLVLSGTNTYRGQTVLRDGVTSIKSAGALGTTAAGTSVNTGAVLSLDGAVGGLTVTGESLSIAGSNGFSPSTVRAGAGTNAWAGTINFIDNQGAPVNVEAVGTATLELRGSLGGAAEIHKVGSGTVSFTGAIANTITGATFVDAGVLALGNTGGNATNGPVVVGDGTGAGTDELRLLAANQLNDGKSVTVNTTGLFNLNGFNDTIGGSPTALTVAGGRVQTGAGILSLNGDVNAFAAGSTTNIDGNIDGNVFLTSTRTFLFLPTPQLTIQSSTNSSQFGNAVTFIVTAFPFGTEPSVTGNVTFFDGDTRIGAVQSFQSNGVGSQTVSAVTTTTLTGGLHTIRAVYSGSNFYASTSITMTQQQAVRNVPVFATLGSSNLTAEPNPNLPLPPTPSQSVTYTYRATAPVGSVAPTGTVTFFDNGVAIGAAQTLTPDGFAYVTTSFPVPTTAAERFHTITATYSGDLFYASNTVDLSAPIVPVTVAPGGTTPIDARSVFTRPVSQQVGYDPLVQLTTNNNASSGTRTPTIDFQASGAAGQPTPAGTVQFYVNGAPVGTTQTLDAAGRASLNLAVTASQVTNVTWAAGTVTATTLSRHHLESGDRVTITGLTPAGYNGTYFVTRVDAFTFTYALAGNPGAFVPPTANGATVTSAAWSGGFATVTTAARVNINTGGTLTVAGVTPVGYNGTFAVTALDFDPTLGGATQFTYQLATSPGTYVEGGAQRVGLDVLNATWASTNGGTATITTATAHGLNTGDTVTISGLNPDAYNGTFAVTQTGANTFTYSLPRPTDPGARVIGGSVLGLGSGIVSGSWAGGTVTITTAGSHNLESGDRVTISGVARSGYDGTFTVTRVSNTQFTYTVTRDPGTFLAPSGVLTATWANNTATVTTTVPHGLTSGDTVTIAGLPLGRLDGTANGYNGTYTITVTGANTFTYGLATNPGGSVSVAGGAVTSVQNTGITQMSWSNGFVTFTTSAVDPFQTGDTVTITNTNIAPPQQGIGNNGNSIPTSPTQFAGRYVVTRTGASTYQYALPLNAGRYISAFNPPGVTTTTPARSVASASWSNGTATITTTAAHGLAVGNTVILSGLVPAGYNGTYIVTGTPNGNTLTFALPADPGTYQSPTATNVATGLNLVITNATFAGNTATITTASGHGLANGGQVIISFVNPGGYNTAPFSVTATVLNGTTFTYQLGADPGPFVPPQLVGRITRQITNATWASGTVTATSPNHGFVTGQVVTITNAIPNGYNVNNATITVVDANTFTYAVATDPGTFFTGVSTATASRAAAVVGAVPTAAPADPVSLTVGNNSITAEYRSTDAVFNDARAALSVNSQALNTPVIYQMLASRTAVQVSTFQGEDPNIQDPASFTFRVNANDGINYTEPGRYVGDPLHPAPTGSVTFYTTNTGDGRSKANGGSIATVPIGMIGVVNPTTGAVTLIRGVSGEATVVGVKFRRDIYSAGTTSIDADYAGDKYYAASSQSVTLGLLATNTPVKFSTNRSIAVIGEPVQFAVDASTLATTNNVPTVGFGTVIVSATNTATGAVSQVQFGVGSLGVGAGSLSFGTPGTYTVQANFIAFQGSPIGSATVTLNPNLTVIAPFDATVTSNRAPAAPAGAGVTFTFRSTVSTFATTGAFGRSNPGGAPLPGTVEFYDGINKIGTTQTIAADGTASITLSTLSTGTHTISAIFTPPNGSPYPVVRVFMDQPQVVGTPPTLDINTNVSTAVEGDPVVITVAARGDLGIPTGRVTLSAVYIDYTTGAPVRASTTLATNVLIRNGVASFIANGLTAGRYTITAQYSGDSDYAPSLGTMTQDLVIINPVRLQVRSSANANVSGSVVNYPVVGGTPSVTYTAEVRNSSTAPINPLPDATGSVTFNLLDANNNVVATTGPVAVGSVVTVIDATTTLRVPTAIGTLAAPAFNPAPGANNTYRVVAQYSGDVNYSPLTISFDQPVVANAAALPAAAPAATGVPRLVPTLNVNGSIQGGASTGLISSASGTLVLNGPATYGGTTLVTGAGNTLKLGVNGALPATTALTVTAGTLDANGKTDTVGSLTGTGTVSLPAGSQFTTGALNTNDTFIGTLTGPGTLNKVGTGALTLATTGTTSTTYTGTTNVNAGTVFLASNLGSSNATVQSGATLGGTGTAKAVTVAAGGVLSPGGAVGNPNTVGVLSGTGNLALTGGSRFVVDVKGAGPAGNPTTGYDQFATTGAANLGGATLALNLAYAPAIGDAFTVVTATAGVTGTFGALTVNGAAVPVASNSTFVLNNRVYRIAYNANNVVVSQIAVNSSAALTSSANPSSPGQSVTFAVTITPALGADPTPVGSVQFFVNGTAAGAPVAVTQVGTTNAARATLTTTTLPNGPNAITATFTPTGGSNYQARTQAELALTQSVSVTSATTLSAQQGPIVFGDTASFLAGVPQQSGLPIPTGTFALVNAATGAVLATGALDGTGRAVLSSGTIPAGTIPVRVNYSGDNFYRASVSNAVTQIVDHQNFMVVGSDAGPITTVQVYDPRLGVGSPPVKEFQPFDLYTGGVKVATGDVNGDGINDIIVSAGAGAPGGHVKVYDGATLNQIASFFTFPGFTGGVNIAAGDVDGDGFADVVVGAGAGAGTNGAVKVVSGQLLLANGTADPSTIASFFSFPGYQGGVTVAAGDVDGDGRAEIVVGSASSAGHVKVFTPGGAQIGSYFAYGTGYLGGIFVAAGDLDGDGRAEIITGATNAPHVKALKADSGAEVASFFAYLNPDGLPAPFGVRVGAIDRNGDRLADILTGSGGSAPAVKVFSGLDPSQLIDSFISNPTNQKPSTSGVFVGGNTK